MKADIQFDASSVNVDWTNGQKVEVQVKDADVDEIIESIGLHKLLEHLDTQELIDHLRDEGYEVVDE